MTFSEFRAWFAGYVENIDGVPTLEQWERIKSRLDEVSAASPAPVYSPSRPGQPEDWKRWLFTNSPYDNGDWYREKRQLTGGMIVNQ
jgi:hypothetical protein